MIRKIWVLTILTVLLLSGKAFAEDSVKPDTAPGWLINDSEMKTIWKDGHAVQVEVPNTHTSPKVEVMTDTQLRQKALAEVTLTDTWLKENGYTRENKEEVMKLKKIYEKDGLYYFNWKSKMVTPEYIPELEWQIEQSMMILRSRRNKATQN